MTIRRLTMCLLLPLAFEALPARAELSPTLAVGSSTLEVSGITPHGEVVWFGVARELADYAAVVVRRDEVMKDEDGDGKVTLDLEKSIPPLSVWLVVDLTTGAFTAATPEGSTALELPASGRNAGRGGPGDPDWTEAGHGYLEMAVLRPGEGAWTATVGDGGDFDEDGADDGQIVAALDRMTLLASAPEEALETLQPGDVVAVVDPNTLEYYIETIASSNP